MVRPSRTKFGVTSAYSGWLAACCSSGYGYVVNAPSWDFGRLLGVYVVFFFLVAQALSWAVFGQRPDASVLAGGGFIVVGGVDHGRRLTLSRATPLELAGRASWSESLSFWPPLRR